MIKTHVNLFRSIRIEQFPGGPIIDGEAAPEILYPDFEERQLATGDLRKPDIQSFHDDKGIRWVKAHGGTSLFDRAGVFKSKVWLSFEIPNGTMIPDSLIIVFTGHNKKFNANHYQIEPKARTMRMDAYKGALDNLARNAIARAVELAKTSVTSV